MRNRLIAATVAGAALTAVAAAPALAYPPVNPGGVVNGPTTVPAGSSVSFTFGTTTPFLPGSTVDVSSICTIGNSTFLGPHTVTTANAQGLANVSLTFTNPGTCVVTATGVGANGQPLSGSVTVTITSGGGGGGGGGKDGGSLPSTGSNGNTATIAAIGGGLLLAGAGAVFVARRRERNHS